MRTRPYTRPHFDHLSWMLRREGFGLHGLRGVWGVMAVVLVTVGSWGQSEFHLIRGAGQARSAVVDAATNSIYLAIYDQDEVRRVDAATRKTVATAAVGQGPAALARSADGKTLACVNRLSGTLTLLRVPSLEIVGTVSCGSGAMSVAATPDGGFAVTNAFTDSIVLVNPADVGHPRTIGKVHSVPSSIAAAGVLLGVTTLSPAALLIYHDGADTPTHSISLSDSPVAVTAVDAHRFVVATRSDVLLVDGALGKVIAQRALRARDITASGGRLLALTKDSVRIFDLALKPVARLVTAVPARAVAANGDCIVVMSPVAKAWQIALAPHETPVAVATGSAAPASAPIKVAQAHVETFAPKAVTKPPVTVAAGAKKPVESSPENGVPRGRAKTTAAPPASVRNITTTGAPAGAKGEAGPAAPSEKPLPGAKREPVKRVKGSPESQALRAISIGAHAPAAPTFRSFKPSPFAIGPVSEKKAQRLLTPKPSIGSNEGGFTVPGLEHPAKFTAEEAASGDRNHLRLKGGAQVQLGNTHIASDEFTYNKLTNEMEATGHVVVTQEFSSATADHMKYTIPKEAPAGKSPLGLTPEQSNRLRLHSGVVEAEHAHIVEPTRELRADSIHYDLGKKTGVLTNVTGRAGQFYFGAKELRILGPASADGKYVWVTTCDRNPPHYRIRMKKAAIKNGKIAEGTDAQLQIGGTKTPIYWPKWSTKLGGGGTAGFDFRSGHYARLGYFAEFGQQFDVNDNVKLGYRLKPTTDAGIGVGMDANYDYMETPASPLFRSKGEFHGMYTTKNRGYWEFYHRQEVWDNTVLLLQSEQWSDRTFYKDFYYDKYKQRTEPRTFANLTYTRPTYLASATVRETTNNFVAETERLPEFTYHLLDRPLADHLYFSFDSVNGYNQREPAGTHALRLANVARLTYDWNLAEGWNLSPYYEAQATWYSEDTKGDESDGLFSNMVGVTLQSRFHKEYPGAFGFSAFKNVIVPSITYSYRPPSTMNIEDVPRFDSLDNVYGHSRIESKIDSLLFGRDASTGETWQVGRLTFYQGNDFWNELRKSRDYTVEMDIRPRQYLGAQMALEHHSIQRHYDIDEPFLPQQLALQAYEEVTGHSYNPEMEYEYNARYGDYNRFLSYLYYDERPLGGKVNGRLGYAYAETQGKVFNREVLYGLGYRLSDKWAASFEQRYDFKRDKLVLQTYELHRNLHCWEASIQMRQRESGWDVNVAFDIKLFPGSQVTF